jgi:hypothetical protein
MRKSRSTSRKGVVGGRGRANVLRGEAGRQQVEEELAKQKARKEAAQNRTNQPFRLYVKPGTTKEVIVLDEAPDWYMYEHQLQDPQTKRWNIFTGCLTEKNDCPVCKSVGREGYYALVLSVIDLEPYTTRDGKTVEWSRKLMVVKTSQIKKFVRRFDNEGSLRGAVFELSRDGDKEPATGSDIELVEFVDEDELKSYKRSWKDREGKTHKEDCSVPFDYEKIFEEPTYEGLAKLIGVNPNLPGSDAEADEELDDENDWDEEEDEEETAPPPRSRRGRRAKTEEVEVDEDEEVEEEEEADEDEEDPPFDADEEEEEEKPARRSTRKKAGERKSARPTRPARPGRRR